MLHNYPIGVSKRLYPIFILDDRDLGIEGIVGGVPVASVWDIIQNSTRFKFAGPLIPSIREVRGI